MQSINTQLCLVIVKKQDSNFKVSDKAMYVPFGQKKLKLAPEVRVVESEERESDFVATELVYFKVAAPGLLEDPFFKNPLLTDEICSNYEVNFSKWLNNVLTPPVELESFDVKVNAAEMWARSLKMEEEFNLAPSKEIVSSRYLSVKVNNLRAPLQIYINYCAFYHSSRDWIS
jgi:hypothetical protein